MAVCCEPFYTDPSLWASWQFNQDLAIFDTDRQRWNRALLKRPFPRDDGCQREFVSSRYSARGLVLI